jgi:hypothetical protein
MKTAILLLAASFAVGNAWAFDSEQQNLSYSIGVRVARMMDAKKKSIVDPNAVAQGLKDAAVGSTLKYSDQDVYRFLARYASKNNNVRANELLSADKNMLSYSIGSGFGKTMFSWSKKLDSDLVAQGLVDGLKGVGTAISEQKMDQALANNAEAVLKNANPTVR